MPTDDRTPSPKPAGTVLVVDDFVENVRALEQFLIAEGYQVLTAQTGRQALEIAAHELPDIVLTDIRMPNGDGFDVCRELKAAQATRLTPVVLITGATDADDRIRALDAGASDFLSKPIDVSELRARVRSLVQLKRFTDDLDSAEAVLRSLARTIEARDVYTDGHCERLAHYAVELGRRLQLANDDLLTLGRGGYFHDIGKIGIPDAILLKRAPLTAAQRRIMNQHPLIGDRLCGDLRALHRVRPIVRSHHERLDGSGYPDGLRGDAIPLLAQIISIVDVYDAITSHRPHQRARSQDVACAELLDEAKRGWRRRDLVEMFIAQRTAHPPLRESDPVSSVRKRRAPARPKHRSA